MNTFKYASLAGRILAALLVVIGLVASIMMYASDMDSLGNKVIFGLDLSYVGVGLILLIILGFIIRGLLMNPKSALMSVIAVGIVLVIFFIGYAMGNDHVTLEGKSVDMVAMVKSIPSTTLKMIDGALTTVYILIGLSLAAIVGTEVWKIFK
jgi:hypothetical protein